MSSVAWVRVVGIFACLGLVLGLGGVAAAKGKPKAGATSKAAPSDVPAEPVNACGCYKNAKGACVCTDKKAKCDCAGECEPVGCAEKREKEMEREMAAEVKRAQDDERQRKAAEEAAERGETIVPDAGAAAATEEAPAPPAKAPATKSQPATKARPKAPPKS
jgi:hypothetical protein